MRILLVDPDDDRATTLGRALATAGAQVSRATSGSFALTMLEWNPHDVVASRLRVTDMNGQELCSIMREDPGLKELRFALVIWPDEVRPPEPWPGVDLILPSTMSGAAMLERIRGLVPDLAAPMPSTPPGPFTGVLDEVEPAGLVRSLAAAGRTGHLLVALAGSGGAVAFEAGRVVHAEFGEQTGSEALVALVSAARRERRGQFYFVPDEVGGLRGTPRTVHQDLDELLREG